MAKTILLSTVSAVVDSSNECKIFFTLQTIKSQMVWNPERRLLRAIFSN
jgi:hypothetical protein